MDPQIPVTVIVGLLIAVGIVGTVVPVLPGSILVAASLLTWALVVGEAVGWIVFGIGGALVLAGMLASAVLTGRRLRQDRIPSRSVLVGAIFGVAGLFLIPVVGLIVGFATGLLLAEYVRQRDLRLAFGSSVSALKATGIGILVEFGLACAAGTVWVIGAWIHFAP